VANDCVSGGFARMGTFAFGLGVGMFPRVHMIAALSHLGYKPTMKYTAAILAFLVGATPVTAHPHIFVDTGLDLYFDADGTLSEIKVTWRYDAFYSLLITQDMGLDLDGDGVLTDIEMAELQGFDMNWSVGFNGDLSVFAGDASVPLSAPRDYSTAFVLGRITTFHTRDVSAQDLSFDTLQIKPYDETYYTSYDVAFPVTLHGIEGCETRVQEPQQTAAMAALQQQLSGLPIDVDPSDVGLGDVGALLATTVIVSCAAS
jgi:ABC-type uncharacterized transport system substrate-binding protein